MNKVYKVVKGKVCHEYARGAGKGLASATAVALAFFASSHSFAGYDITTDGVNGGTISTAISGQNYAFTGQDPLDVWINKLFELNPKGLIINQKEYHDATTLKNDMASDPTLTQASIVKQL